MKAAIISLGSISSKWLVDELKKFFDVVDHIDIQELEVSLGQKKAEILYKGKPLPKYDCIYAKGSFRYAVLLRALTTLLQKDTYMPLKPGSYTIGHDKVLTHLKFQEFGVPQPTTYIASTADAGKKIIKKIPFPVIMKLPAGTHGKGVMLADSPESASSMIDALALLRQPFLIQEYIETDGINLSPGLQGITKVTKINVASILAEFLFKQTKAFRDKGKEEILKELGTVQEIEGSMDFRGNRMLLPEVVTMSSKIKEGDDVVIKTVKGRVEITKTASKKEKE
ncbi:MAG: hypothetical protein NTW67_02585 [Candidatus Woesearchaeota archaeon]|nr:hypothetical protein [Candidatus Woesearchaeota archaeon]